MIRSRSYFSGFGSSIENHCLWLKSKSLQRGKVQQAEVPQQPAKFVSIREQIEQQTGKKLSRS